MPFSTNKEGRARDPSSFISLSTDSSSHSTPPFIGGDISGISSPIESPLPTPSKQQKSLRRHFLETLTEPYFEYLLRHYFDKWTNCLFHSFSRKSSPFHSLAPESLQIIPSMPKRRSRTPPRDSHVKSRPIARRLFPSNYSDTPPTTTTIFKIRRLTIFF